MQHLASRVLRFVSPLSFLLHFLDPFGTGYVNYKSFVWDFLSISNNESAGLSFPQTPFLVNRHRKKYSDGSTEEVEEEEEEEEEEYVEEESVGQEESFPVADETTNRSTK